MDQIVTVFLFTMGGILLLGLGAFGFISYLEKESRAMKVSFGLAILSGAIFSGLAASPKPVPTIAFWGVILERIYLD